MEEIEKLSYLGKGKLKGKNSLQLKKRAQKELENEVIKKKERLKK